jgi:hypothetical protein
MFTHTFNFIDNRGIYACLRLRRYRVIGNSVVDKRRGEKIKIYLKIKKNK